MAGMVPQSKTCQPWLPCGRILVSFSQEPMGDGMCRSQWVMACVVTLLTRVFVFVCVCARASMH